MSFWRLLDRFLAASGALLAGSGALLAASGRVLAGLFRPVRVDRTGRQEADDVGLNGSLR